jgi:DNA-binding FrmR family transcriptional regulator
MVDDEDRCIDIATQISAVRVALRRIEEDVLTITWRVASSTRSQAATRPISAARSRS